MKRGTVVIISLVAAVSIGIAAWGGYSWSKEKNTPPPQVTYNNVAELDKDIERLEKLKGSGGLSWQEAYTLGVAYVQKGNIKRAVPLLEDVARRRPSFSKTFGSLGMAYFRSDEPGKAAEAWEKALKLDPKAEFLKEMIERAKRKTEVLDRIASLENEADAEWQKKFELAALYMGVKRFEEAKSQLMKIIAVKGDSPEVYDALAETYAITGDFDKAIDAERKAVRLDPKKEILRKRLSEMEKVRAGLKKKAIH